MRCPFCVVSCGNLTITQDDPFVFLFIRLCNTSIVILQFFRFFQKVSLILFPAFPEPLLYPKSTKFYQSFDFGKKSLFCAGKPGDIFMKLLQFVSFLNEICCFSPNKASLLVDFGGDSCIMVYRRIRISISSSPSAVPFWLRAACRRMQG